MLSVDRIYRRWLPPTLRSRAASLRTTLATPRAQSTKRCATGLRARLFKVTIPIGLGRVGKAIGKALGAGFLLASGNVVIGRMDRNRPLATSARRAGVDEVTIVATGTSRRAAQKASRTIEPVRVSSGGRTHGFMHQVGEANSPPSTHTGCAPQRRPRGGHHREPLTSDAPEPVRKCAQSPSPTCALREHDRSIQTPQRSAEK